MGGWRDAVNDMENMDREQPFVASHSVRMRGPTMKMSGFLKGKEVLFLIAQNSVVELIAMVYSGANSTNRCWKRPINVGYSLNKHESLGATPTLELFLISALQKLEEPTT